MPWAGRPAHRTAPLAVEVTTALLLAALAARVHPGGAAFAGTVLLLIAAAAADGHWHVLARAVLGGIALVGFYLVLALISPSGMGMGDVKAAAGLGTMRAWRGWTALIAGGFAGFLFAAV